MKSEQTSELAAALAKAQGQMKPAHFDKVNPHFKSRYASLASCWEAIRAPLSANGLALTQAPEWREGGLMLITTLMHTSGQWIQGEMAITGATPQQQGSSLSYVRRYSMSALLGIVSDEDDDGEQATRNAAKPRTASPVTTKEKSPSFSSAPYAPDEQTRKSEPPAAASAMLGEYVIPVTNKFYGKKLKDITIDELSGLVRWYMDKMAGGGTFGAKHKEFIEAATQYIDAQSAAQAPAKSEDTIPF